MGFENMRVISGFGRCPFLLEAFLLMTLFFLMCKWWSLNSKNMGLLKEQHKLETQLKQYSEQLTESSFRIQTLEGQLQQYEEIILRSQKGEKSLLNELTASIKQYEDSSVVLNKTENSLELCEAELDSIKSLDQSKTEILDALRYDNKILASQLADRKSKILELEAKISNLPEGQVKQLSVNYGDVMPPRANNPAESNKFDKSTTAKKFIDPPNNDQFDDNAAEVEGEN